MRAIRKPADPSFPRPLSNFEFRISNLHDGFTFVEVLVALLIASLLVTVACAALITSLRAEERAMSLREERYELRTAATHEWAGTGD